MKRLLIIILYCIGVTAYAVDYTSTSAPVVTMQSVNNAGYMTTGSTYSSAVYEVGSGSPSAAPPGRSIRRSGFDENPSGNSDYNPNNPQFSPLGDAVLPLLLMALLFGVYTALRRKKKITEN